MNENERTKIDPLKLRKALDSSNFTSHRELATEIQAKYDRDRVATTVSASTIYRMLNAKTSNDFKSLDVRVIAEVLQVPLNFFAANKAKGTVTIDFLKINSGNDLYDLLQVVDQVDIQLLNEHSFSENERIDMVKWVEYIEAVHLERGMNSSISDHFKDRIALGNIIKLNEEIAIFAGQSLTLLPYNIETSSWVDTRDWSHKNIRNGVHSNSPRKVFEKPVNLEITDWQRPIHPLSEKNYTDKRIRGFKDSGICRKLHIRISTDTEKHFIEEHGLDPFNLKFSGPFDLDDAFMIENLAREANDLQEMLSDNEDLETLSLDEIHSHYLRTKISVLREKKVIEAKPIASNERGDDDEIPF